VPSGKTHTRIWKQVKKFLIPASILLFIFLEYTLVYVYPYSCAGRHCFTNSLLIAVGYPVGYLIGKIVTPDLDMPGITETEWAAMREAKLLGVIFTMYWMPYGYFIPHRNFWSHSYFFSTAIRMIYLFWWILFFRPIQLVLVILLGVYFGLASSDALHIWFDRAYKENKNGLQKR